MPRVFISYSRNDRAFAERLAADLEKNGITAWIDRAEMRVGDTIAETIHQAIEAADFLIAVISRSALESKWVRDERRVGDYLDVQKGGKFVLPALIEDVALPVELASRQYADFRKDYDQGLHDLLVRLAKTPPPPPPKRWRLLHYAAASIVALLMAGTIWTAMHRIGDQGDVIEFSNADLAQSDTAPAGPFLHDHGIRVVTMQPEDSWLEIAKPQALYRGEALHRNRNVLKQTAKQPVPVSFTLTFSEPLTALGITRAALYPHSKSGISHPRWSAHAFDFEGDEIASAGEPFLEAHQDVPAHTFMLAPANARIVSVRIDGDLRRDVGGGAAFHSVLIDELIVKH